MSKDSDVDLTEDRLFSLGFGLIFKIVCVPKSWEDERISDEATKHDAPGTSANRWVVSTPDPERNEPFKNTNRVPCNDDPNRQHVMVNC